MIMTLVQYHNILRYFFVFKPLTCYDLSSYFKHFIHILNILDHVRSLLNPFSPHLYCKFGIINILVNICNIMVF